MRKIILTFLLAISYCIGAWATQRGVTFILKNGNSVSYAFSQQPVINLDGTDLKVMVEGKTMLACAFNDIQRISINEALDTSVSSAPSDDSRHILFSMADGTVEAQGIQPGESVSIYSADGKLVKSAKAEPNGTVSFSTSSLGTGTFIVKTSCGFSYKMFNK